MLQSARLRLGFHFSVSTVKALFFGLAFGKTIFVIRTKIDAKKQVSIDLMQKKRFDRILPG